MHRTSVGGGENWGCLSVSQSANTSDAPSVSAQAGHWAPTPWGPGSLPGTSRARLGLPSCTGWPPGSVLPAPGSPLDWTHPEGRLPSTSSQLSLDSDTLGTQEAIPNGDHCPGKVLRGRIPEAAGDRDNHPWEEGRVDFAGELGPALGRVQSLLCRPLIVILSLCFNQSSLFLLKSNIQPGRCGSVD